MSRLIPGCCVLSLQAAFEGLKGAKQAKVLRQFSDIATLHAKRDRAILALLIGCRPRRAELVSHLRTVPLRKWTNRAVDNWLAFANIKDALVFRKVSRAGRT